ncbi:GNAT family N-acetyltransferase [Eubacteriaceae bacterium ES3]|nr:GNAT family N-acetyltransferase [Eubacteriaceae bacterium ES3]
MIQRITSLTEAEIEIRTEVFVDEQGFNEEFDTIDGQAVHLLYYLDKLAVAVCRYYPDKESGTFILGRFAVRKPYRGKNLGKELLAGAEKEVLKDGGHKIVLSSQVTARSFYEKCGFTAIGEVYLDEHCPHIRMEKTLS